jgi:1-deoxy-D-xylulose-5-phosphate reductoisomerase
MKQLVVLGATGTVGRNTLDVAARHPQRLSVLALTAARDVESMVTLCQAHRPRFAAMADAGAARELAARLAGQGVEVLSGMQGLCALAAHPEATQVMSAIVGAVGLLPTLAAVRAGKQVLIANKEPLVMAGPLLMDAARAAGAVILPIDSEHNALFQCLPTGYRCGSPPPGVAALILTASGGPFRDWPPERLASVTPAQAVRHPNWVMGPKISVDSATMMNKGLELIEAAALYGLPSSRLSVVVHPESAIHSLVSYVDGSLIAQIGSADMRIPIAHALAWPERWDSGVAPLDLVALAQMRFEAPDLGRFPCLRLAREALEAGGSAPLTLNAANEVAVEAFLAHRLRFTAMVDVIADCLARALPAPSDADALIALDAEVRTRAWEAVGRQESAA